MTTEPNTTDTLDDRTIAITRILDAPRELVFTVWTEPHHVAVWWGPNGFTTTTSEMDLRPGGIWRYVMHGPDGTDYDNLVVFEEIVRPERLVYTLGADESDPMRFHVTVTFDDLGGRTELTMRSVFPTAEYRELVIREHGAMEGATQSMERIAAYLESVKNR